MHKTNDDGAQNLEHLVPVKFTEEVNVDGYPEPFAVVDT